MKKYFILSSFLSTALFLTFDLMTVSAASAPAVKTAPSLNITYSSAALYGGVNPEGSVTAAWFEYGTQSGVYDSKTPFEIISDPSIVNYSIGSLSPNNTYYFRLAAKNINGVSYGAELSFKTLLAPPSPPVVSSEPAASFSSPSGSLPSSNPSSSNYQSSLSSSSPSSNFSSISSSLSVSSSPSSKYSSVSIPSPNNYQSSTGDVSISNMVEGYPLTIKTFSYLSGAIGSITWNGKEFIDRYDHGRELQSASSFDDLGECFNPTEAGARDDTSTSTSVLQWINTTNNTLESQTRMSFWLHSQSSSGDHCGSRTDLRYAQNITDISNHLLHKKVSIGWNNLPNVIEYLTQFILPTNEKHTSADFEALTGYMPPEFTNFYSYNPETHQLILTYVSRTTKNGLELVKSQDIPPILATSDGKYAMGVYCPDVEAGSSTYNTSNFNPESSLSGTVKWNCFFKKTPVPAGKYDFRAYIALGTLQDVVKSLDDLDKIFHAEFDYAPVGWLDKINTAGIVSGWALDMDVPNKSIYVDGYLDGVAGTGKYIGRILANDPRQDVNDVNHVEGNHGFSWLIPKKFRDGKSHQLYVYGINNNFKAKDQNPLLQGAPKDFNLAISPFSVNSALSVSTSFAESSLNGQSSSVQPVLSSPVSAFTGNLTRGSVGEDVRNLQILLAKDKSIYPEGLITGAYGPLTEKAVKRLQAKYNLPQVGEIGPLTKLILQSMTQSSVSASTILAKILKSSPVSGFSKTVSMSVIKRSAVAELLAARGIPVPFSGVLSVKNNYLASPADAKKIKFAESQPPLLSLNFDSGLSGTNGEAPTRSDGTDTIGGLDGNGVDLSAKSNLAYSSGSDNFNKDSGTFELWFRPHAWSTDGQVIHRFLDARFSCPTSGCFNYMLLDVDNYNKKIIFKIDDAQTPWDINGSGEKQSVYNFSQISQWQWHHLAVSWDKQTGSKMYFDGKLVSSNSQPFNLFGNPSGDIIFSTSENNQLVGNMSPGSQVDFLNIYGYPKTSDEIAADYSALKDPTFAFRTDDASLGFKISGKMLHKFSDHQDANVAGQDGGLSISYNGKSFWLFDDTNLINGNFTNNNIALDKSADFPNLSLDYKKDAQGNALPILTPQNGEDLIWPSTMFNDNGIIYTYYDAIKMDETTWFYGLGQGWAKSTSPITDINKTEFVRTGAYWPSKGKTWTNDGPGYPVYDDGNYVYMTQSFGKKDDGITVVQPGSFMTRVKKSEVENIAAHEYWNGSSWTKDKDQKLNIFPAPYNEDTAGHIVGWNSYLGKYLMVHAAGPSLNLIAARVSDSVTGPWSQAKIIADCDKSQNNLFPCYAVQYHPEYDKNGGQTIYLSTANWQRYYLYGTEINLQKN
ncbi:MAG: peptidoglycan-binding protein [Patescibacteria group bacterium]|nr:peptidoglycan-binding protein [Patescibacteria group bacterium]